MAHGPRGQPRFSTIMFTASSAIDRYLLNVSPAMEMSPSLAVSSTRRRDKSACDALASGRVNGWAPYGERAEDVIAGQRGLRDTF